MSLPRDRHQQSLFGMEALVGPLFARGERRRFVVFAQEVVPALEGVRGTLEGMYCARDGRPAIDPVLLAGVTLLQYMEGVPDREAAERVVVDLGWKRGLGLPLEYAGFHATSLVVFRNRLVAKQLQAVVFDAVLGRLEEAGLVRRRGKQRLDSTHIVGCVARMSTLELVRETLRLVLEAIRRCGRQGTVPEWALLWERYCEGAVQYRGAGKAQITEKLQQAGLDAHALLTWWGQEGPGVSEEAGEQLALLERVCGEQFEWAGEGLQPRKARPSGAVCNPHDPEAQWACKDPAGKTAWVGYKVQLMETVAAEGEPKPKGEPTEQFLTELSTTEAIASDIDGMQRALAVQEQRGQEPPSELYTDAAYVSADTLYDAQEAGTELVGPARPAPERDGLLSTECFDVDNAAGTAVCPAGKVSTHRSRIRDKHQGTEYYRYEWGKQCDECPLRPQCTRAAGGRRALVVGLHHDLLQARRREMQTEEFQQRMRQRNAIEGSISELKRGYGLGRARYRGLAKAILANYVIGAACNARRWISRRLWEMDRGLAPATA